MGKVKQLRGAHREARALSIADDQFDEGLRVLEAALEEVLGYGMAGKAGL